MLQLKDNLTHTNRAHATYWLKVHSFINLYWYVREENLVKINFERERMRALSGYLHKYIPVSFSVYVHT